MKEKPYSKIFDLAPLPKNIDADQHVDSIMSEMYQEGIDFTLEFIKGVKAATIHKVERNQPWQLKVCASKPKADGKRIIMPETRMMPPATTQGVKITKYQLH